MRHILRSDCQEPYICLTVEQLGYINCVEKFTQQAGPLRPDVLDRHFRFVLVFAAVGYSMRIRV